MSLAKRQLTPEWLDELPAEAPEAVHSRGDLRRLNALMGNVGCLASIATELAVSSPKVLVELACGDGRLMSQLLKRTGWRPARLVLVDRQPVVTEETLTELRSLVAGDVEVAAADVFAWLTQQEDASQVDVMVTNLFLHHLDDERLRELLRLIAERSGAFIACEPRRSGFALLNSKLVGLIGCNQVTRHDAVVSVQAGFRDGELTRLWPSGSAWKLIEEGRGLFSHCLGARRVLPEKGDGA